MSISLDSPGGPPELTPQQPSALKSRQKSIGAAAAIEIFLTQVTCRAWCRASCSAKSWCLRAVLYDAHESAPDITGRSQGARRNIWAAGRAIWHHAEGRARHLEPAHVVYNHRALLDHRRLRVLPSEIPGQSTFIQPQPTSPRLGLSCDARVTLRRCSGRWMDGRRPDDPRALLDHRRPRVLPSELPG